MYLTKIVVFVAHDEAMEPPTDRIMDVINAALGSEHEFDPMIIEVRDGGTVEVTLGAIDFALENRETLEKVKDEKPNESPRSDS